ncbi:MAG: amidohydrolase [Deltaproteobacteria bacterium]|jgi:aminobenzoyl-glutamate utilization protein A|nr:amidohydrolase [Deltaproteobacteria bacterium]
MHAPASVLQHQLAALAPRLAVWRRDLHSYPETAWTEFRTAALVARHVLDLGYSVRLGRQALDPSLISPRPDESALRAAQERAVREGADPKLVACMDGGCTALWADLPGADAAGPVLAFRFDMDANAIQENMEQGHRPCGEGFASRHPGCMHACGHDGHTALGLGLATLLTHIREDMRGGVRLIFQPAEEGGSGARPMLKAGALDGVDYLVGLHIGIHAPHTGSIICGAKGFMASSGFDARYTGRAAHAGLAPHEGRNALLAACSATLGIYAITRHGDGSSRINVGQLQAGQARNVIPDSAVLKVETRGASTAIDAFMLQEAQRIVRAAGDMWNCACDLFPLKAIPGGASDSEMSARIARIARSMPAFTRVVQEEDFGATEDFTVLLEAVQKAGGQGAYIQIGAERAAGHHNERFDFDENALPSGLELLARIALDYLGYADK